MVVSGSNYKVVHQWVLTKISGWAVSVQPSRIISLVTQ